MHIVPKWATGLASRSASSTPSDPATQLATDPSLQAGSAAPSSSACRPSPDPGRGLRLPSALSGWRRDRHEKLNDRFPVRYGVEIELRGLSLARAAEVVSAALPGSSATIRRARINGVKETQYDIR
ncbi:MAG TPA: hypothetical protein VFH51_04225, partial [Myxococcota bacterium]|nr:hypothetical protein [Myxococcota bacterium]